MEKRAMVSVAVLIAIAATAWFTMAADNLRLLTMVLLGFFAFRIVISALRAKTEREREAEAEELKG